MPAAAIIRWVEVAVDPKYLCHPASRHHTSPAPKLEATTRSWPLSGAACRQHMTNTLFLPEKRCGVERQLPNLEPSGARQRGRLCGGLVIHWQTSRRTVGSL